MHLTTARRCAPRLPPNKSSVLNLTPKSRSHHTQTPTQPILDSLLTAPVAVPRASLLTPARLNRHNRLPTGGSLQTAVSDAPRNTEPTCTLTVGRIRYSTRVSGQLCAYNGWSVAGGLISSTDNHFWIARHSATAQLRYAGYLVLAGELSSIFFLGPRLSAAGNWTRPNPRC